MRLAWLLFLLLTGSALAQTTLVIEGCTEATPTPPNVQIIYGDEHFYPGGRIIHGDEHVSIPPDFCIHGWAYGGCRQTPVHHCEKDQELISTREMVLPTETGWGEGALGD